MKKYIVEKEMRNNTDGYFNVVVEGETHLNRTVISSSIQYFTTEGGYDYCHPWEGAKQNAQAMADGLNRLERLKEEQKKPFPTPPKCEIRNGDNSWEIKVDGKKFNFVGHSFAEFLRSHYESLGYQVSFIDQEYEVQSL